MGNTYGTWLPGDPRGFRTRHHRQHVEGDYHNPPPPGAYDQLHARSKKLIPRAPVQLSIEARRLACDELARSFLRRDIELIALSVDDHHFHLLARFPDHDPRHWLGVAKKESSHHLKLKGHAPAGGLWATRTKCLPIQDRAHQLQVVGYILGHERRRATLWCTASVENWRRPTSRIDSLGQGNSRGRQENKP